MTLPSRQSTHETRAEALLRRKHPERLTPQQEQFVLEYLVDLHQTNAAIRAGYDPHTAQRSATKMMKAGTLVSKAVARAMAARAARTGYNADRTMREVAKIAFGDPRKMFDSQGRLLPPSEYSEDDAAMLSGVKTRRIVEKDPNSNALVQVEIQEVRLADKMGGLLLMARHLGILNDKLDVNVNVSLASRLDEAFKRTGHTRFLQAEPEEAIDAEFEEVEDDEQPALENLTEGEQEVARRLMAMRDQEAAVRELLFGAPAEPVLDLDAMLGLKPIT